MVAAGARHTDAITHAGDMPLPFPAVLGHEAPARRRCRAERGAAAARFSLDHLRTLWGKRVIRVPGGGGRSGQLIPALVELHRRGRFPFDRLVRYYEHPKIEQALADSKSGAVIKPIPRMPG